MCNAPGPRLRTANVPRWLVASGNEASVRIIGGADIRLPRTRGLAARQTGSRPTLSPRPLPPNGNFADGGDLEGRASRTAERQLPGLQRSVPAGRRLLLFGPLPRGYLPSSSPPRVQRGAVSRRGKNCTSTRSTRPDSGTHRNRQLSRSTPSPTAASIWIVPAYFAFWRDQRDLQRFARASHSNSRSCGGSANSSSSAGVRLIGAKSLELFGAGKLQCIGAGRPHGDQSFAVGRIAESQRQQIVDSQLLRAKWDERPPGRNRQPQGLCRRQPPAQTDRQPLAAARLRFERPVGHRARRASTRRRR